LEIRTDQTTLQMRVDAAVALISKPDANLVDGGALGSQLECPLDRACRANGH
jgi:hypothetical protein